MWRGLVLASLVVIAGCWRDGPGPAPTPLRPAPTSPEPETTQGPRWRQTNNVAPDAAPDPARTLEQIAQQLATDLRASGPQLLTSYIAGPVVVLDLEHCRGDRTFTCSQFATQQILIVELADPDQWRLVSVIVGNFRTGRTTMSSKMGQMRSLIAFAACP